MRWLLLFLLAAAPAHAKKKILFGDARAGTLLAVDGARLKSLPGATVHLTCITTASPSEENHQRNACESFLKVERGGRSVARLDSGVGGMDFEAVGGNDSNLSLELVPVEGGALVAVRASSRRGDEGSRETAIEQLFVVDGSTLREVYAYEPLRTYDPGPDGKEEERERNTAALTGGPRENDLPTLILTINGGEGHKLAWDGKGYAEAPVPPLEPLIARVLAGKRLTAAELKPQPMRALSKLRNAPYARHGRPFKNPELRAYFYAAGTLKANPAFADSQLDADDQANLGLVLAEIKRRVSPLLQ